MSSLQFTERNLLEKILGMRTGYVSDFSDRTFREFVLENTGIDISTTQYEDLGTSKANRLRTFWKKESDEINATLIGALLEYSLNEKTNYDRELNGRDQHLFIEAKKIVQRLKDEPGIELNEDTSPSVDVAPKEKSTNTRRADDISSVESIENLSDESLLAIIRRAENTHVPGSSYQRANTEWQIRHQQRMVEATKSGRGGIMFEVGGDMTNHGVIQTGPEATVGIAVAGNYSSNDKTKIIQGSPSPDKEWYEKPLGLVLIGVTITVIAAGIVFLLHWN